MIDAQGGIDGRKVSFISYHNRCSPPRHSLEQSRKLIESDDVLLIFNSLVAPDNTAILKYINAKKVSPVVASGTAKWNDPQNYAWTIDWQPNYQSEARIYAKYS